MLRLFVTFIIFFVIFLEKIINLFFDIRLRGFLTDKIRQNYRFINIKNKKLKFFSPSHVSDWRIESFFSKEPETLKWIKNFKNKKNSEIVFWDIGSNIGLYTIFSAFFHKKINVISFEPSFLNLGILSRNISINNFERKIQIMQLPLSDKKNKFQKMMETSLTEGGALSSFGYKFDHEGKKINAKNIYSIIGTSLDDLIKQKIIKIPDYIKIDVDGTEHIILKGMKENLKNKKIKSILIEVNKKNKLQFNKIKKIMKLNNFALISEEQSRISKISDKNVFNFIYMRK